MSERNSGPERPSAASDRAGQSAVSTHHEQLWAKLNGETGKLRWSDLQRHFARGAVIRVDPRLDLVTVAATMAADDAGQLGIWLAQGAVARASDAEAARWSAEPDRLFWAVVVAPWVVVQAETADTDPPGPS